MNAVGIFVLAVVILAVILAVAIPVAKLVARTSQRRQLQAQAAAETEERMRKYFASIRFVVAVRTVKGSKTDFESVLMEALLHFGAQIVHVTDQGVEKLLNGESVTNEAYILTCIFKRGGGESILLRHTFYTADRCEYRLLSPNGQQVWGSGICDHYAGEFVEHARRVVEEVYQALQRQDVQQPAVA